MGNWFGHQRTSTELIVSNHCLKSPEGRNGATQRGSLNELAQAVTVCICLPGASAHIMSPGVTGSHEPVAAFLERVHRTLCTPSPSWDRRERE